jgi:2,4-dienoyl-CoA reductase-like NADH-dependent reductase (Old Yellow Enzyme family)
VAKAVRNAAPSNIALGARINSTDFIDDGLQVEDAVQVGKALRDHGFDYVCVSSGNIVPGGRPALGPGFNVERAARIKRETGLVTRTVGFIAGPKHAEEVVSTGGVDQVALARAFLDDSNWGWHAAEALGHPFTIPPQYQRVKAGSWPGAKETRAFT